MWVQILKNPCWSMKDLGPLNRTNKPHPNSYSTLLVCIPYIPFAFFQLFQNLDATFDKNVGFWLESPPKKSKAIILMSSVFAIHHLFLRCVDRNLGEIAPKSFPSNRTSDCFNTTTHTRSMIRFLSMCHLQFLSWRTGERDHPVGLSFVVTLAKTHSEFAPSKWDEIRHRPPIPSSFGDYVSSGVV